MKNIYFLFLAITFNTIIFAQNVFIPDANFKSALVGNPSINTNMDTEIQISEAAAYAGTISVQSMSISDLTGIEAFTALIGLECNTNPLGSLNVTQNTALTSLHCGNTLLTVLDVSQNINLIYLTCGTSLTSLDVSQNINLTYLVCSNSQLTSLDITQNTALTSLFCFGNQLTNLDVTQNTALTSLFCFLNQINTLNITQNIALTKLDCGDNQLTSLNVKNGNNINFTLFGATNNPNLTCIQVDDSAYSTNNWTNIDPQSFFSTNCGVGIDEANNFNEQVTIYPNPASSFFNLEISSSSLSEPYLLQLIDVTGKVVLQKTVFDGANKININLLLKGYYTALISNTNDKLSYKKLIIN